MLHPRNNEVHEAGSSLPPKERRSGFRLHRQVVLRVGYDNSSIRSLHARKPLLDTYGAALTATGEHLLPKHKYSDLTESVDNLVLACTECNRIPDLAKITAFFKPMKDNRGFVKAF